MKKAIYFFQYLPPWRVDVFNRMAEYYDLTVVFFNAEQEGFTYDRKVLLSKLKGIDVRFLTKGFSVGSRPVRFGIPALLKEIRPDVVFVHEYSTVSVELSLLKRRFGYRLYLTTSDTVDMAESSGGLKAAARGFVLRRAEGIVLYSRPVEAFYKTRFPWLKTGICPNIQNPESLLAMRPDFKNPLPDGSRVILYMGRLVDVKGLDLLLDTFAAVEHAGYRLVLVGEGREREPLQRQAERLEIASDVLFAGFQFGAKLYEWYDRADFFVLPSRFEPFGAVVNESLVLGCPVLASKYIGALGFINDRNGIVFDPLDSEAFRSALSSAMARFPSHSGGGPREGLLDVSFDEAVKTFKTIDDDAK
ncbi:MAG: glycosyltransferase [Bacteroidales bacterium]|nr:glycosyltransferase [Bacteroidales bacterium]